MERRMERFILCVSPNHTMPEGMVELYPRATSAGMFDFQAHEARAREAFEGLDEAHVYISGLTVYTTSVCKVARELGIKLYLYHYDRDTNDYVCQEM